MKTSKPKFINDFNKLNLSTQAAIRKQYPNGFNNSLVTFLNEKGNLISAVPFETPEVSYLVRISFKSTDLEFFNNTDETMDDSISLSKV